ncbi:MAG: transglutaminase domain-containing protein [Ignavibacteriae bacterium]|nr:MAG: transglutaminase domain-containing protein [Ignavibacteriota bacterium]
MKKIFFLLPFFIFITFVNAQSSRSIAKYYAEKIYERVESDDKDVIATAKSIINRRNTGSLTVEDICKIYDYMYNNWTYVSDPDYKDDFQYATESLQIMQGDCEDFAIAIASLVNSVGGDARVIVIPGHCFAEVYLTSDKERVSDYLNTMNNYYTSPGARKIGVSKVTSINYHYDKDRTVWINFDYTSKYPGGPFMDTDDYTEHIVVYEDGTYRMAYLNIE